MTILGLIFVCSILLLFLYLIIFFKYGYVESDNNVCLLGKTALVTGGSSGIGYQIVLSLLSRGCKVIIADKLVQENIKTAIINETDNQNVILEYVDFASFKSIRKFVEKISNSKDKLDILINNVGIGKASENLSEDGLNQTMQINYYGPFLLTYLLKDLLRKSNGGRIVFTTSLASFMHNMTPLFVTSNHIKISRFRMHDYTNAKFLTVVSSDMFAEKLRKFNITCNTYHPGIARSTFFNNTRKNLNYFSITDLWSYASIHFLMVFVGVPPKKAAQAGINLATSKKFGKVSGIFFGKYWPSIKPKLANDPIFCNKIWKATEEIVKLEQRELL